MPSKSNKNKNINIIEMPSQTTDYTCGPSALIGYCNIIGLDMQMTEMELANKLNCIPYEGTRLIDLANFAQNNLKAISFGENTWDGAQMMIAIITEKTNLAEPCTHAVIVLGKDYLGSIVWWCSLLNEVKRTSLHEFNWRSVDGQYIKWSINFPKTFSTREVSMIADLLVPSSSSYAQLNSTLIQKAVNN